MNYKALQVKESGNYLVKYSDSIYVWISKDLSETFELSDKKQWNHISNQEYITKTEVEVGKELEVKIKKLIPETKPHKQTLSGAKGFDALLALREKMPEKKAS